MGGTSSNLRDPSARTVVRGCLPNNEKSRVGNIVPTTVVVSDKENKETSTKKRGHGLTNREEPPFKTRLLDDVIENEEVPPTKKETRPKKGERDGPTTRKEQKGGALPK